MSVSIKWGLLVWMCCAALSMLGQQSASFKNLSKKDGLSQSSVFAIAQDSAGFMWFGTRDGLNKFDGYQFKVYKNNSAFNSLGANDIRTLYFAPKSQKLWIGTMSGLSKYHADSDDFTNYSNSTKDTTSLSNDFIRQIYEDSKGRLWIGTSNGLNLHDEKSNNFIRYFFSDDSTDESGNEEVQAILEDAQGQVWFGTQNGLFLLSGENKDDYTFKRIDNKGKWQLSDTGIKSMLEDDKGNFWIGTFKGGINYWDRKNETITVYQSKKNNPNALSNNNIRSLCLDNKGNLWVGTFDGLNYLKKGDKTFTIYKRSDLGTSGLSDNSIRSAFIDNRGSLWVGTYFGGINHLDEKYNNFTNFKNTPNKTSLSWNVVSSFAENEKGDLWIGTEGGGLNFYDIKKKQFKSFKLEEGQKNTLSGNNVKQILLDGNLLWVGTFQAGLNLFDLKTEKFQHFKNDPLNPNSLSNNDVYGLLKKRNKLWVLTYGGGLDILDLKKNIFYNYRNEPGDHNSLSSDQPRVILKTKNNQLWIGTKEGLNKVIENAIGFPERFEVFLPKETIYSLQEDAQQNIWIGTISHGLYYLNPKNGHIKHFTNADGLPGNTVFGILEVGEEELWLSTNNGLSKFNPKLETFTNYNYFNGLENSEYSFNAYYKTRSGDLLFGGINGFTRFNPNAIQPNQFIPPVAFTELRQNGEIVNIQDENSCLKQSINEVQKITFNYNQANFSIGFAALDYFSPENNRYAFMLEGLDRDWNYTIGKTEATYTIQREGEYIFRLKGANSDGIWNPEERQLKIMVLPPAWRTWWAYLIYLIFVGATIFGLFRFIQLRHKLQLEQISKQQQQELHEVKLRFFTNITHEFRTPLTLILGPLKDLITKEKHDERVEKQLSLIERNAQRLLNLVNQVLTFRKIATDHEPMEIVRRNIVEYLREIFLPFQESANLRNITYQFEAEPSEINAWFDQDKLGKVFFNLLSNAFKFTSDGGKISMHISQNNQYIKVRVKDDGVGIEPQFQEEIFKRFYEKSNLQHSIIKGTGIGLAISKQMVELHRGEIFVENITENSTSIGATFVVKIPKGKAHFKKEDIIEGFSESEQIAAYSPLVISEPMMPEISKTPQKVVDADSPLLLIVEDNPEISAYIQQIFANNYRLITAQNGSEGLQKTKKDLPDLIISDVMMPQMDGITFCGKLKNDLEVSHIPIILLTARTASLFKIEGLTIGADDYITKPFNPDELRLKVRNRLVQRQRLREKFGKSISFEPKEIAVSSADEVFLEKLIELVNRNIDNPDCNIEQFAQELAISRALLFTKIKAFTNLTPKNFLKTFRLKRAAQLLKTGKLNVSEVAYQVGFKEPRYFSKVFLKEFAQTPTEFAQNVKE